MQNLVTAKFSAQQMGYLRRKELDTGFYDAWEFPDGQLLATQKGQSPQFVRLITSPIDASARK